MREHLVLFQDLHREVLVLGTIVLPHQVHGSEAPFAECLDDLERLKVNLLFLVGLFLDTVVHYLDSLKLPPTKKVRTLTTYSSFDSSASWTPELDSSRPPDRASITVENRGNDPAYLALVVITSFGVLP